MSVSQHPPLDRTLSRLRGAFWRRRFLRGVIRAMWLALLVPTIVMAGYLWLNWEVPAARWIILSLFLAIVTIAWAMRPIDPRKMAIRLDEIMGLRSQLITAYEVTHPTNPDEPIASNPVTSRLLQEGVAHITQMRQRVRFLSRGFWLELHTFIVILAFLVGMLLLDALAVSMPETTPASLPGRGQEPRAQEVAPQESEVSSSPRSGPGRGATKAELEDALAALADALRDQAVTRAAADALDRGDVPGAAEAIDIVSRQVGALSELARHDLGDALQEAADNIEANVPDLTRPLERGSSALLRDNIPSSSRELENLADALDSIADTLSAAEIAADEPNQNTPDERPPDGEQAEAEDEQFTEEGDGAGGQETDSGEDENSLLGEKEERLPIDGQPLELESDSEQEDRVLQPSDLQAQGEGTTTDSPFARQPLNASGEDLGADLLTYPWEKRDIVQDYFTPKQ